MGKYPLQASCNHQVV